MKKILAIIIIIIIFLLLYFLQSNFFTWFNIAGIKPNLFVILALYIGLFAGKELGITLGLFLGICLDILIGKNIGVYGVMLGTIGLIGGYFDKRFSKESKITIILMCMATTIFYEIGVNSINKVIYETEINVLFLITTILIEVLFNIILLIILYPLLKRLGYAMQNVFKGNNILTKYF